MPVYDHIMTAHAAKKNERRTTMAPVTTMEELPVLDADEREAMLASLEEAEARIAAGEGIDYDPKAFADDLRARYHRRRRA